MRKQFIFVLYIMFILLFTGVIVSGAIPCTIDCQTFIPGSYTYDKKSLVIAAYQQSGQWLTPVTVQGSSQTYIAIDEVKTINGLAIYRTDRIGFRVCRSGCLRPYIYSIQEIRNNPNNIDGFILSNDFQKLSFKYDRKVYSIAGTNPSSCELYQQNSQGTWVNIPVTKLTADDSEQGGAVSCLASTCPYGPYAPSSTTCISSNNVQLLESSPRKATFKFVAIDSDGSRDEIYKTYDLVNCIDDNEVNSEAKRIKCCYQSRNGRWMSYAGSWVSRNKWGNPSGSMVDYTPGGVHDNVMDIRCCSPKNPPTEICNGLNDLCYEGLGNSYIDYGFIFTNGNRDVRWGGVCEPGENCRGDSKRCRVGYCLNGVCAKVSNGWSCDENGDCALDFCNSKMTCGKLLDGQQCGNNNDCSLNFCNSKGTCGKLAIGSDCSNANDCISGECYGYKCIPTDKPNGAACTFYKECLSDICNYNVCLPQDCIDLDNSQNCCAIAGKNWFGNYCCGDDQGEGTLQTEGINDFFCRNNIDDDCDGLVDTLDSDCCKTDNNVYINSKSYAGGAVACVPKSDPKSGCAAQ